ncbi:MAG: class I tRNA ligase family protein, partial [Cloacibacterium sp.]|nr:class I tRNA ligase family protein [Cloacibacterium sp.]
MFYDHKQIEQKWQKFWEENQTYKTENNSTKPKFYVLDMFPYPSGAGLHVGHPLGYIASDIYARFKRHQGFNVLHPIGYDSFGLPAEQYAIQTGQHPAITTEQNITRYEEQLRKIGFSFDWSREVRTSDASYYKWTQWIFIELFHSWYNKTSDKAESIKTLVEHFSKFGTENLNAVQNDELNFTAEEWNAADENKKQDILLNYRLAYRAETTVNWCPALGTVLANDEVKDGKSERGGYPVFQKKMMQWSMRITAYSERLLNGLKTLDWPQPLKDSQEYWIGKSQGAAVKFKVEEKAEEIEVFTTRPDTIFGATFMVLAPENPLVSTLTTAEQKSEVENYIEETSKKTERDRMADVKNVSGAFTGSYAVNPFTGKNIPIYISDY